MLSRRLIDELHAHEKLDASTPETTPATNETTVLQVAAEPFAMDNRGVNANNPLP